MGQIQKILINICCLSFQTKPTQHRQNRHLVVTREDVQPAATLNLSGVVIFFGGGVKKLHRPDKSEVESVKIYRDNKCLLHSKQIITSEYPIRQEASG